MKLIKRSNTGKLMKSAIEKLSYPLRALAPELSHFHASDWLLSGRPVDPKPRLIFFLFSF